MRIAAGIDIRAADVGGSEVSVTTPKCKGGPADRQRIFKGDTRRGTDCINTIVYLILDGLARGGSGVEIDFIVAVKDTNVRSRSKSLGEVEGHAAAELDAQRAFLEVIAGQGPGIDIVVPADVADCSHEHWTPLDVGIAEGARVADQTAAAKLEQREFQIVIAISALDRVVAAAGRIRG